MTTLPNGEKFCRFLVLQTQSTWIPWIQNFPRICRFQDPQKTAWLKWSAHFFIYTFEKKQSGFLSLKIWGLCEYVHHFSMFTQSSVVFPQNLVPLDLPNVWGDLWNLDFGRLWPRNCHGASNVVHASKSLRQLILKEVPSEAALVEKTPDNCCNIEPYHHIQKYVHKNLEDQLPHLVSPVLPPHPVIWNVLVPMGSFESL